MKKFLIAVFVAFTLFSTVHAVGLGSFKSFKDFVKKMETHDIYRNSSYIKEVLSAYGEVEKRALFLKYKNETDHPENLGFSIHESSDFRATLTLNKLREELKKEVEAGMISESEIKAIEPYRKIMFGKLSYEDGGKKVREKLKYFFGRNKKLLRKLIALACGSDFNVIHDESSIYPTGACG